jgi:hypothetical protein
MCGNYFDTPAVATGRADVTFSAPERLLRIRFQLREELRVGGGEGVGV